MKSEPGPEHAWLKKFLGEWTYEGEMPAGPDQPAEPFRGTQTVRPIGELWIQAEDRMEAPGSEPAISLLTLGFDPRKGKFVGTFVVSIMDFQWVYEGTLDATRNELPLETDGPDMVVEGRMTRYRDVHRFVSADHRVLTAELLGPDGTWSTFMTVHYRRK